MRDAVGSPRVCVLIAVALLLLGDSPAAAIETIHPELWVANNDVRAIAQAGNTLYIAGLFDYLGPGTGGFAAIDLASGTPVMPAARVAISSPDGVFAAVADGAGGWFIGGQFFAVG